MHILIQVRADSRTDYSIIRSLDTAEDKKKISENTYCPNKKTGRSKNETFIFAAAIFVPISLIYLFADQVVHGIESDWLFYHELRGGYCPARENVPGLRAV